MLEFLTENGGTIAVALVLAVILILAFIKTRKDRKNGCGCGCGCAGCPSADICHSSKEQNNKG